MESEDDMDNRLSHPDVCRCCLSSNGTRDVTSTYINDAGTNEIYSEMLQECFGISLSYLVEWGPSRKVCQLCIEHLRDAQRFKQQVLQAEEQFEAYYRDKTDAVIREVPLKTEMNMKTDDFDENGDDTEYLDEEFLQEKESIKAESFALDNNSLTELPLKRKRGRPRKNSGAPPKPKTTNVLKKNKRKLSEVTDDSDSDIPISGLKKDAISGGEDKGEIGIKGESSAGIKKRKLRITESAMDLGEMHEEGRKIRSNVALLLHNVTITPFKRITNYGQCICSYCNTTCYTFKDLKQHYAENHSQIEKKDVKRALKNLQGLIKVDISEITCKLCDNNFKSIEKVAEHLVKDHNKVYYETKMSPSHRMLGFVLNDENNFKCHICCKSFLFFQPLSIHMNEHSDNFICYKCGKKFFSIAQLEGHMGSEHSEPGNIPCEICNKIFKTHAAKSFHKSKIHSTENRLIKCSECPMTFKDHEQKVRHLLKIHKLIKKTSFTCNLCGKVYLSPSGLSKHVRYFHTKCEEYVCDTCGRAFVQKWLWKRHMMVHTGERNYECNVCHKKFAKKAGLEAHYKLHINAKEFKCPICARGFNCKFNMRKHMKVHRAK